MVNTLQIVDPPLELGDKLAVFISG